MFIKPFKTIVVGVDFSEYSKLVVEQAQVLARRWKARVVLVHSANERLKAFRSIYLSNRKPPSTGSLKERVRSFYNLKKTPLKIIIGYDNPTRLISSVAKEVSQPLVMAGYTGHSQLAEMMFGSTAHNLVHDIKGPVWIHRGQKVIEPNRILVPHDLSRQAHRAINLCENLKLIQPLKYDVFFVRERPIPVLDYSLYVNMQKEMVKATQSKLTNLLAEYPRLEFHSTTGDVTEKIVEKTKDFDLILITHQKQRSFLSVSETSLLMKSSQAPLLII